MYAIVTNTISGASLWEGYAESEEHAWRQVCEAAGTPDDPMGDDIMIVLLEPGDYVVANGDTGKVVEVRDSEKLDVAWDDGSLTKIEDCSPGAIRWISKARRDQLLFGLSEEPRS